MFIATNKHIAPIHRLEEAIGDHLAWLERLKTEGKVLAYGILGTGDGGFTFFSDVSETELLSILEEDPFCKLSLIKYSHFAVEVIGGLDELKGR